MTWLLYTALALLAIAFVVAVIGELKVRAHRKRTTARANQWGRW